MAELNLRDVEVFKPYTDEFPEHLLLAEGVDDDLLDRWIHAEILRIARYEGEIVGVYAMDRRSSEQTQFDLHGIVVERGTRRRGLGRWLTGHALGVAESKGGRTVWLKSPGRSDCFRRMGFVDIADGLRFDAIPE